MNLQRSRESSANRLLKAVYRLFNILINTMLSFLIDISSPQDNAVQRICRKWFVPGMNLKCDSFILKHVS